MFSFQKFFRGIEKFLGLVTCAAIVGVSFFLGVIEILLLFGLLATLIWKKEANFLNPTFFVPSFSLIIYFVSIVWRKKERRRIDFFGQKEVRKPLDREIY